MSLQAVVQNTPPPTPAKGEVIVKQRDLVRAYVVLGHGEVRV